MSDQPTKECFKCNETKPLEEFYRHKMMADGHLNKCKDCAKRDVSKHREENLEKVREHDRLRGSLPHRVELRKKYWEDRDNRDKFNSAKSRWNKTHQHKRNAHLLVQKAVRSGKLIKPVLCETCSCSGKLEAHHDDYDKPLDVRWLCVPCHTAWHVQDRERKRKEPPCTTA